MKSPRKQTRKHSVTASADRLEDDGLPDLTPLIMGGKFVDDVTAVGRSNTELFLGTGRLEKDATQVLVPFVEMTMLGVRQGEIAEASAEPMLAPVFQHTMTLENALWLTFDILRDIRHECVTLNKIAKGEISLDPARLAHARFFAEKAREQAEMCVALFDELPTSPGDEPPETAPVGAPAPAAPSPPKRRRTRLVKKT